MHSLSLIYLNYWLYKDFFQLLWGPNCARALPSLLYYTFAAGYLYYHPNIINVLSTHGKNRLSTLMCKAVMLWNYINSSVIVWLLLEVSLYYYLIFAWQQDRIEFPEFRTIFRGGHDPWQILVEMSHDPVSLVVSLALLLLQSQLITMFALLGLLNVREPSHSEQPGDVSLNEHEQRQLVHMTVDQLCQCLVPYMELQPLEKDLKELQLQAADQHKNHTGLAEVFVSLREVHFHIKQHLQDEGGSAAA